MEILSLKQDEKLSLKTGKDNLDLFFIGVGSAFARTLNQTNFLLIQGDTHIMVDFGMTGPNALRTMAHLEPTDIECILPTHSHADHVGGCECLALMNRYVGQRFMKKSKLKMIIAAEYQRVLWDQTLRGGLEWNEETMDTAQKLSFGDFFDTIRPKWKTYQPREIFEVEYNGMRIELFRTKHIPEQSSTWEASFVSFGLYLPDFRVFMSGDSRFDLDLINYYAPMSDYMFHDVQFFQGAVHAPLDNLKTLPKEIKDKMYLTHYADNYLQQDLKDFQVAQQGIIYRFKKG
jgi:ribonuclease BN (tRNA processing enzyme)